MSYYEWTDQRVELLIELNAAGLTKQAISDRLGGGVTRNAVIGKLNRLKLLSGNRGRTFRSNGLGPKVKRHQRQQRVKKFLCAEERFELGRKRRGSRRRLIMGSPPSGCVEAIVRLERGSCRWPVGDQHKFLFCMRPTNCGPYCTDHMAIAYRCVE